MITKELETKLQKLSTDYIYNQTICSLLLLLISCSDDITEDGVKIALEPHNEIKEIKDFVKESVLNMENDLDKGQEHRTMKLTKALELKNKLMSIYENYFSYYSGLSIVSNLLNDEMAIRKYKDQKLINKTIDFASFYTDIIDFIESVDNENKPTVMSKLAKCIPLNMTRDKYFDIVKNSLYLTFDGHSQASIDFSLNTLKFTSYPEGNEEYGKYFPEIAQYLKKSKSLIPSELSDTELDTQMSDFDNMFEVMNDIDEYFNSLYNDVNALAILYYSNFSFEELIQDEFIISDIYHSCCEFINNPEDDLIKEIFEEKTRQLLEENTEMLIDKAAEISKKELQILEKITDFMSLSEDTQKILASEGFVRAGYYETINQEVYRFNGDMFNPPASKEYKENKFNEFIDVLKNSFTGLNNKARKSAMQVFISSLPLAINMFEFLDFVKLAIDNAPSFEHKILIVDKVGMIFEDYGFNTLDSNEHEHHHHDCNCGHDHHHHDCDCGHDHHHHDCDCGHDHHNHDCDCGCHNDIKFH